YRSYPKRYVREIYNNLSIVMGIHRANKMINSCSLCGLCAEVCPGNLDLGEICLEARRTMVDKGKMPLSTHDFALRDMRFSNSERCALSKNQPGFATSQYVFFPGCQLAASSPNTVKQAYVYLTEQLAGGVGLMLGCCGAPAIWAGQEALFQETMRTIESDWHSLGEPQIIAACPACCKIIEENLPNLPVKSVWEIMDQIGLPDRAGEISGLSPLAIHDSCTARYKADVQNSVRNLAGKLGCQVEELPLNRDKTTCCSYGGLMFHANREVADKVIRRRVSESESDYLTYCIMCRDNFAGQGKRAHHLLDLIFAEDNDYKAGQKGPGYSQRQENRERLKNSLLQDGWGEMVEERHLDVTIVVPEQVRPILEERMILDEDIRKVIAYAERSGNKLKHMGSGCYIAYLQIANVTYWVEYSLGNDTFIVRNAYSHRITITE
ncbi:MAG: gltA: glutamate synthase homotetrameric, partial [Firmicutes bacterium]|nr:gltA: glutamate synthase homotetrameric [Bacillota bacterium]